MLYFRLFFRSSWLAILCFLDSSDFFFLLLYISRTTNAEIVTIAMTDIETKSRAKVTTSLSSLSSLLDLTIGFVICCGYSIGCSYLAIMLSSEITSTVFTVSDSYTGRRSPTYSSPETLGITTIFAFTTKAEFRPSSEALTVRKIFCG